MVFRCIQSDNGWLAGCPSAARLGYGTGQESGVADWRHTFLAYDYAYEGAVRVTSAMACHASDEARGIIRGASL